jgi:hypothetical protein
MQSFPPGLLALSDSQLAIIMAAAHPLQPADRSQFLEAVAARLAGVGEVGDGAVSRACRELQRSYFDPPQFARGRTSARLHERQSSQRRNCFYPAG